MQKQKKTLQAPEAKERATRTKNKRRTTQK
jgi:hypothetical protein